MGFSVDFRSVKCVSMESGQTCHFMIYSVRLICTTAISLGSSCMLFTTLDLLLPLACGSQSTARGIGMRWGKPWIGVNCICQENICSENLIFFYLIKEYVIPIKLHLNANQHTFYWWMCTGIFFYCVCVCAGWWWWWWWLGGGGGGGGGLQ